MTQKNTKFDTRLDQRNHKRKKNNILNILIGIVILLIIIVTVNIVADDDETESTTTTITNNEQEEATENEAEKQDKDKDKESEEVVGNSTDSADSNSANENSTSETEENESNETEENEADTVTTEPSNDSNVESVVIDSGWQPIGTEQSGDHVSSYNSESVDWDEKVKALAYGANLDPSNMYVKFIGNGGGPQKSIGTVTSKDGSEIYRISLEFVPDEGWKPTKKEILKTLK